jgi:Rrf2 family transcriptional regulator, nitric oxide-sensitive transcriptional repressor
MPVWSGLVRLTQYTDFALRVLIMVGARAPGVTTIANIAEAYGLSHHHLAKIVQDLAKAGYLEATRGRGGGLKLALPPESIRLGRLIAHCEDGIPLVECFDRVTNRCVITPVCRLVPMLVSARAAFLSELDRHSLADLLVERNVLAGLLALREPGSASLPA